MSEKVFLFGIDGLPPRVLRKFVDEGAMPNFARLFERAAVVDIIPTLPALTAPGWLSLASGACPSTVGVESILLPKEGAAPDSVTNGFDSSNSRVEYLWEAFDRQGKQAIVLKYPGTWPPRAGSFVQVDGAGGYADISCRFEATPSCAYLSDAPSQEPAEADHFILPENYASHWRVHTGSRRSTIRVTVRPPSGWRGSLPGCPLFEFVLRPIPGWEEPSIHAVCCLSADGPCLIISPDKDASNVRTQRLQPREWSGWFFTARRGREYGYRYKLVHLDVPGQRVHLYRGEGHFQDGYTRPDSLASELSREAGPIVEWTGTYDYMNGLLDLETQYELYEQHTAWLERAIESLAGRFPWSGFFMHWHVIEYAHHLFGASLHEDHPLHDPLKAPIELACLRRTYGLADRLLGTIQRVIGENAYLVIASDHGHDLVHSIFYVNHFLRRMGWLSLRKGSAEIDWTKTYAYAIFPGWIYLNVKGRWDGGILSPEKVPTICAELTEGLRALTDSRTGRHPIKLVMDRDDMLSFGQGGGHAGDLFFCMDRGYEPATRLSFGPQAEVEFEWTVPSRELTSGHGSFFPASASARTMALFSGPGIQAGPVSRYPQSILSLAPTICELAGVEPPRHCEGHALRPRIAPDPQHARPPVDKPGPAYDRERHRTGDTG